MFGEDKDEILGMVNVKDFFINYMKGEQGRVESITSYMRPVIEVMETVPIHDLLLHMQKKSVFLSLCYTMNMAVLQDL
ncbi:hypothetical protein GCM10020331_086190 [Ectobacillus funiculus]